MSGANTDVLLEEGKAYWVDSASMGLLPDKTLVREWRNIPIEHLEECKLLLLSRRKYTDPKTQTKTHTGLYRIQKVEDVVQRDREGRIIYCLLRETLAFGLATTLVGETSRMGEGLDLPSTVTNHPISPAHEGATAPVQQDYKTRVIKWVNLDPNSLAAIVAERSGLTATDLVIGGATFTGSWFLLSRKPSIAEDGSGVYEETWGLQEYAFEAYSKKGDMETTASRYIQGVPKSRVKAALDAEVALLGTAYGRAGFTYEQKLYWRNDQADIITESTETPGKTVTKTSQTDKSKTVSRLIYKHANSIPDADTAAQGVTVQISGRITEDGDFDYDKETITAVKLLSDASLRVQEASHSNTVKVQQAKNLYDSDLTGVFAAPNTAPVSRTITSLDKSVNDDGTFDAVAKTDVRIDQSIAAPASLAVAGNMTAAPTHSSLTQIIDGADAAPDALGSSYGSVNYTKDKYGTYVGARTITTYNSNVTIPGWVIGQETSTQYVVDFIQRSTDKKWFKRTATLTLKEGTHVSLAIAMDHAKNGYSYAHFKSGYGALGVGQYWSTWVSNPTFTYEDAGESTWGT